MNEAKRGRCCLVYHKMVAVVLSILLSLSCVLLSHTAVEKGPQQEAKAAVESVDPFMGDWEGTFRQRDGKKSPLAAQVVALGKGRYHANLLTEFDKPTTPMASLEGRREGDAVRFIGWGDWSSYRGPDWDGVMEGGQFTGSTPSREGGAFELRKVVRLSPTLGQKPPAGAAVLFDGTNFDQWEASARGGASAPVAWNLVDGAMEIKPGGRTIGTKQKFTSFQLHVEFRVPFMPEAREQQRGNSGVHFHGLEIQVLDCYGLEPRAKGGGGIYNRVAPRVNMCAPPMQWQTYDIAVQPPDKEGKSRLTVLQNGVTIHDGIALTVSGPTNIRLSDHGNRVQYRNIWLVELR